MRFNLRDALQEFIDLLRGGQRRRIRATLTEVERLVAEGNWERAVVLSRQAADAARRAGHFGLVSRAGRALEQLGEFEGAARNSFCRGAKIVQLQFAVMERRRYEQSLADRSGVRPCRTTASSCEIDRSGRGSSTQMYRARRTETCASPSAHISQCRGRRSGRAASGEGTSRSGHECMGASGVFRNFIDRDRRGFPTPETRSDFARAFPCGLLGAGARAIDRVRLAHEQQEPVRTRVVRLERAADFDSGNFCFFAVR